MFLTGKIVARIALMVVVWLLLVAVVFLGPFEREEISVAGTTPKTSADWFYITQKEEPDLTGMEQLVAYVRGIARGTLATTLRGTRVSADIARVLKPSVVLVAMPLLLSFAVGVVGLALIRLGRSWLRWLWQTATLVGLSVPETLVAGCTWSVVICGIVRYQFKPFPVFWIYNLNWRHYVLPVIAMSVFPTAYFARAVDSALSEIYARPFLQVARAKGLSESHILFRHVWRHLAYRIVVVLPALMPWLLSSLIIIECLFLVPGVGRPLAYMLARGSADPALMAGILTLFFGFIVVVQLGCASLSPILDPRHSGGGRGE